MKFPWSDLRDREAMDAWEWRHRWDALARYNSERGRGLVHTPEYVALMAEQQAAFDREQAHKASAQ